MPNLPRPRILPKVTYGPGGDVPNQMQTHGGAGSVTNPMGAGEAWDAQRAQAMGMMPQTQTAANVGQSAPVVTYDPNPTAANYGLPNQAAPQSPQPNAPANNAVDPRVAEHANMQEQNTTDAARLMDAANKNRANTTAAQNAGDTASLARLNAEWERIQQSPLWKQMYGGSDPNAMKQRLVNVYMNPKNSAAQNDLAGALSSAVADDVWAQQATQAFGRPPNQLEWDEHWKAMNVGGRDPLEGHPQAIQNIKATMQSFQQGNQQTAYDDYSNWAGLGH